MWVECKDRYPLFPPYYNEDYKYVIQWNKQQRKNNNKENNNNTCSNILN